MSATAVEAAQEYDRITRENTRPAGWRQWPEPGHYHLVVIGGGTAGLVASGTAAILGARVALIERAMLGGDCTHTGCVPSKALLRSARAAYESRHAGRFAVDVAGVSVDFARVMERMRAVRAEISKNDSAGRMASLGVEVLFGEARFTGPDSFEVDGKPLRFSRAIVATGSAPRILDIPGMEEAGALTNESVFDLETLPASLLVVGGGPVGCELAQAFRRLGSEVTLLTEGARLLPHDDADAAAILEAQFMREGIRVCTSAKLLRIEQGRRAVFDRHRGPEAVEFDRILLGVGRRPRVENLGLEAAGIAYDHDHGIRVDDHLRTTNRRVFAAGDVCWPLKFTHAAQATGTLAAQNALLPVRKRASQLVIPWCTYTQPEVAHVGMGQHQAAARRSSIETFTKPLIDNDRAVIDGAVEGFTRLYLHKRRIVGATIVGEHAGDLITQAVLAMREGLRVSSLSDTIAPYPTHGESLKGAADAELLARVKPWMRALLGQYFRVVRR